MLIIGEYRDWSETKIETLHNGREHDNLANWFKASSKQMKTEGYAINCLPNF